MKRSQNKLLIWRNFREDLEVTWMNLRRNFLIKSKKKKTPGEILKSRIIRRIPEKVSFFLHLFLKDFQKQLMMESQKELLEDLLNLEIDLLHEYSNEFLEEF